MARITTFTEIGSNQGRTALEDADVFLIDGTRGSKKITAKELGNAMLDKLSKNAASVGVGYGKSGIYRGANLGTGSTFAAASTADQRSAIANGTFEGLFIGDYWTVNNIVYRIADFNYWKRSGDTDFNTNHVVLIPHEPNALGSGKMNDTNVTTGAYVGSKMYTDSSSALNTARTKLTTDFGEYLATHRVYLANTVSNGAQTAGAWFDSKADLMNELMVYGSFISCKDNNGVHFPTIDKSQLAIFRLNPAIINPSRTWYWLRDVGSTTDFAIVDTVGCAARYIAGDSGSIRPVFAVKGTA